MTEIEDRVGHIEEALVALGVLQFGDSAGHPFRGNQHTGNHGPIERAAERVGKAVYDHLLAPGSAGVFDVHAAFHKEMEKVDRDMRGTEPTGVLAKEPVVRPGGNAYDHGAG